MTLKIALKSGGALALMLTTALVPPAFAASSFEIIGLSADGEHVLTMEYDSHVGTELYKYISTSTGTVRIIEAPAGVTDLFATGLSADGKSVVGSYMTGGRYEGFVWTEAGGFKSIPSLGGDYGATYGMAVSADGSAATGYISKFSFMTYPIYWSEATGTIDLGFLGGNRARGLAISGDGKTVAGYAQDPSYEDRAFVWTVGQNGITDIDTLYVSSQATHVSFDGSVVAGNGQSPQYDTRTFRWTTAGMVDIGTLGGSWANLYAMSNDGNILVGQSETAAHQYQAFRYNAVLSDMKSLGTLGGSHSRAQDVTADGSIVVGTSQNTDGKYRGFRWSEATGMISIEDWMKSAGVTPGNYIIQEVSHVSDDGQVIAGITEDYKTYFARQGNQGTGIIKLDEFLPTVADAGVIVVNRQLSNADTIMFGAQGQPMRNLLTDGQKAIWGTIDLGRDETASANGNLAVGEFGFGYGFGDTVTARLGVGVINTNFNLSPGGTVATSGAYIAPEVSVALTDSIYATVGGFWSSTGVQSNRGYFNGGALDYSTGSTNAQTWGAKLRFDWVDALVVEDTSFTPYIGLSHARTSVDGYSETGGSFPVTYAPMFDQATIARIGVDIVHELSDDLRILAKAEAAYQFERNSAAVNGTITGLSDFSLAGQDNQQFWVRGGIGLEYDIGGGTASAMVNLTSKGQDPDVWVRANFTMKF